MRINYIKHDCVINIQALTKKGGHLCSNLKINNGKHIIKYLFLRISYITSLNIFVFFNFVIVLSVLQFINIQICTDVSQNWVLGVQTLT